MFDISFGGFINFFLGIVTGMIAFSAILVFLLVRGKKIDVDEIKRPNTDANEDEVRRMILDAQTRFKKTRKITDHSVGKYTFLISFELVEEIARYFFPESKHPTLELSVNELLNLNHYITNRVDDLLEKPILKNMKKMQAIRVMQMFEKKRALEESKAYKAAKKLRVGKVVKYAGAVFNAVNPVYWFRKLVINTSVDQMTKKVCVVIIGIVGEETTKVYSKQLFEAPIELDVVEREMLEMLEDDEGEGEEVREEN